MALKLYLRIWVTHFNSEIPKIIHRDVSVSNVLTFNGGGKLCDLEYVRDMGDENFHDVRTVC